MGSFLISPLQDMELRPLNSFLQQNFNPQASLPMHAWLLPDRGENAETYDQRMHLLGNIVIPACASLAGDILARTHRASFAKL
jgi:hypothetical protein